ncbi:MAG: enolase C-terminal domain-like protein, partial [Cyclobacteriaceae bacterium]
ATNGLPDLKITNVKAIPSGNLVVVKVETSEPGLYGLGDASFVQRPKATITAIEKYLHDYCVGRSVNNINDMWQMAYTSSYWRNGPVLNSALSGIDMALWDIKGKRANMPVYELLGGKMRFALSTYAHSGGRSIEETVENVQRDMEAGFRYCRLQAGGYSGVAEIEPDFKKAGFGLERDNFMDHYAYLKGVPKLFEAVRLAAGDRVELCHDVHSRIQPIDAVNLCKQLEQYRPYYIEDPVSVQNVDYLKLIRQHSTAPILIGENFSNLHEWVRPMSGRNVDFVKHHIPKIGGITPAMKVARLGEVFNVRTNWHGAGDNSPVGHAANCHVDLAIWNFGIQEMTYSSVMSDRIRSIFPGSPKIENGYIHINEAPGLGVDIIEEEAAKYPLPEKNLNNWTQIRKSDGTPVRP